MAQVNSNIGEGEHGRTGFIRRIPLTLRMLFYAGFLLVGCLLIGLPWLAYQFDGAFPSSHVEIGWFRAVGVAFFVACAGLYIYTSAHLIRQGRGAYIEFDPPQELVVTGPYRRLRNPIAACVVGMILGEAVAFSSTGIFLLFLASLPLAHAQAVLLEEPMLRKRFGQAYADYAARVPRWIPRRLPEPPPDPT